MLTKLEAARRRHSEVAFDLYIHERNSVSIQCLACGAGQILNSLAEQAGTEPFSTHILKTRPDLDIAKMKSIRNQFWNAFKHTTTRRGEYETTPSYWKRFLTSRTMEHCLLAGMTTARSPDGSPYRHRCSKSGIRFWPTVTTE